MWLSIAILLTLLFSTIFFPLVIQKRENLVDLFIQQNKEQNITSTVTNISTFLYTNVKPSYNKAESVFEIDRLLCFPLFDQYLLDLWEISRADIIVYQGWGSCGQAAVLIEELLQKLGYETRRGSFLDIDHEWTEVKNGSQWLIVDPWYIGNLVQIHKLRTLNSDFEKASGVEVLYPNGTILDLSQDYGY